MEPESICEDLAAMTLSMLFPTPHSIAGHAQTELVLRLQDGSPWRLSLSAGMERFVGAYPRLAGFVSDGPLLTYVAIGGED